LNDDPATAASKAPPGYAELKIVRRQTEQSVAAGQPPAARDDIILSRWFGGEAPDPGADEAWDRLASSKSIGIRAVRWEGDTDLQAKLLAEIKFSVITQGLASPAWLFKKARQVIRHGWNEQAAIKEQVPHFAACFSNKEASMAGRAVGRAITTSVIRFMVRANRIVGANP
jgi:hypothetical protein